MAKGDIYVNFISDSKGDKAVARQDGKINENVSQMTVIETLQHAVGQGTFISGKVRKNGNGNATYRYTLKQENGKKGSIVINTKSKYHSENDANIKELEAISNRGNSIKYWNRAKLAATCVLVPGIILGTIGVSGLAVDKFVDEMLEESQTYSSEYVDEINKARAENGARPIGWTDEDQEQFERDKKQANDEYNQSDISYQFGDYFEEDQEEKGRSL